MRLFAAVWPPDDVLDHLDLALGAVRRTVPPGPAAPVRWSARETWHLTCAFYGDVPDGLVPDLACELAGVAAGGAPYRLRLRGAGVFAHRTLWVGVGGDVAAQQALVRGAVAAGAAVGARPDERPRDRAHLTVGRVRADGSSRRPGEPSSRRPGVRGGTPGSGAERGGVLRHGADRGGSSGDAGPRDRARRARGAADRGGRFDPGTVVGALAVYEGPEWTVDALDLVASRPGEGRGGGPLYATVERFALGGR